MTDTITGSPEVVLPVPPGLHLHPHQREGIAFAVNRLRTHRGVMFGDVMGVGKTIEAIGTANVLGPRRILVACPASVLHTWWREIRTWQTLGLRVFLIQAGRDVAINHRLMGLGVHGWFIINYDILRNYPEAKSGRPWDLVILDESRLGGAGSDATRRLLIHGRQEGVAIEYVVGRGRVLRT
jgi:SNF2 family DNA or RNA helicase